MKQEIIKQYANAVYWSANGANEELNQFKQEHPEEFKIISAMYRKRVAIKDTLRAIHFLKEPIYWFTLTFNNKKDNNSVESKRKEAQNFLNEIAPVYLMVEEYGEDNGRYHIHGFLVFRYSKDFNDFKKWHSRQKIIKLEEESQQKKIRYLTKYACKDVPRLRRSKQCSKLYETYKKRKSLENNFMCIVEERMNECIEKYINLF